MAYRNETLLATTWWRNGEGTLTVNPTTIIRTRS
jgi:hypothetical protein